MLTPAMSMVPKATLYEKPNGFTWGAPSGPMVDK